MAMEEQGKLEAQLRDSATLHPESPWLQEGDHHKENLYRPNLSTSHNLLYKIHSTRLKGDNRGSLAQQVDTRVRLVKCLSGLCACWYKQMPVIPDIFIC